MKRYYFRSLVLLLIGLATRSAAPDPGLFLVQNVTGQELQPLPGSGATPSQAPPAPGLPENAVPVTPAQPTSPPSNEPPPGGAPTSPSPAPSRWDQFKGILGTLTNKPKSGATGTIHSTSTPLSVSQLPTDQITRGLKEALAKGLDQAVTHLGKEGGFLNNPNVRIPIPEKLQTIEKFLRRAGQDRWADEFVTTMNHAAEKAVPAATAVFADSLKQMTIEDARSILQGPNDAATQYFHKTAGPRLQEKFRPIVSEATSQAGVTSAYKNLIDKAGFASAFINQDSLDLDGYVTTKSMDGLFKMVAEEEKKIRENPVARTTDLLRSVFGALGKR